MIRIINSIFKNRINHTVFPILLNKGFTQPTIWHLLSQLLNIMILNKAMVWIIQKMINMYHLNWLFLRYITATIQMKMICSHKLGYHCKYSFSVSSWFLLPFLMIFLMNLFLQSDHPDWRHNCLLNMERIPE